MDRSFLACLSGALLSVACVSPQTTLQGAKTLDPGDLELIAGGSVPVHAAFTNAALDAAENATDRVQEQNAGELSEAEKQEIIDGALAVVLLQPAFVPELSARLGVVERLDVGLRYAGASIKGDAKFQLGSAGGYDMAVSLGYIHHTGLGASIAEKAFSLFEVLELAEYSRRDLDAAFLFSGNQEDVFSAYGAVRYIWGMPRIELAFPEELAGPDGAVQFETDEDLHYVGGTIGMRLGVKSIALLAELTAMNLFFSPKILGEERNLGGLVLSPALGLDARF